MQPLNARGPWKNLASRSESSTCRGMGGGVRGESERGKDRKKQREKRDIQKRRIFYGEGKVLFSGWLVTSWQDVAWGFWNTCVNCLLRRHLSCACICVARRWALCLQLARLLSGGYFWIQMYGAFRSPRQSLFLTPVGCWCKSKIANDLRVP